MRSKQITCKQFAIITGIQSNKFTAVNSLKSQFLQVNIKYNGFVFPLQKLNTRQIHAIWTFHVFFGHPKVTA